MIKVLTVRQASKHIPVADELKMTTDNLIGSGHEIVEIHETKVNPIPGCSSQGFIIVYREAIDDSCGKWLGYKNTETLISYFMCSECSGMAQNPTKFCQHCGARMLT